jgi:uncharacterized membrane protein (DUF106 family)
MDGFNQLILWLREKLSLFNTTPHSALFIFSVAFSLVLLVMIINRLVTDVKKIHGYELKTKKHTSDLEEAEKKKDKVALRRLKRNEIKLKQYRSYIAKQRFKVTIITIAPIMATYVIMSAIYLGQTVATFPLHFPIIGQNVAFPIWYLLCYFTIYMPLSKIFGISLR